MADVTIYDDISKPNTEVIDETKAAEVEGIKEETKEDVKDINEKVDEKIKEIEQAKTELNEDRVIFETRKAVEDMKNEILDEIAYTRDKIEEKSDEIRDETENTIDESEVETIVENAVENAELDKETEEKPKRVNPLIIACVAVASIALAVIACRPKQNEQGEENPYGY